MMPKTFRMRLLLAGAALLVGGLAAGWFTADDGPDLSRLAAPPEQWKEPALRRADTAKLLADLGQHSLWGNGGPAAAADAAPKAATKEWRLSGIVAQSGAPLAVILLPEAGKTAPHVQYNKIGDELPDGSHIVEIAKTTITVAGESGQRQVKLFYPN
jgi:hypothetical protein